VKRVEVTPTVPIRYVNALIENALARGLPLDKILEWSPGISLGMLAARHARVGLKQFSRLYAGAVVALEDESAGLSVLRVLPGFVETMSRVGATSSSLADCGVVIAKVINTTVHELRTVFLSDAEGIHIVMTDREPRAVAHHQTFEVLLLTVYAIVSWLLGRRPQLTSVDFPSPTPQHLYELRTLFSGKIRFNRPSAALNFVSSEGQLKVVRRPSEIKDFVRLAPRTFIETLLTAGELTVQVRRHVSSRLPNAPNFAETAVHLALSQRSLHRKLKDEGSSFQRIKDELRRDLAIRELTLSKLPLKQIAAKLGFADQVSFQRAFAQWTGRSPGAWRIASGTSGRLTTPT
jgi:AraC-like DNA-binding protein